MLPHAYAGPNQCLVAVADGSGYQTERHCGKVGGRSDESAPANDTLGVYTAGQVHGRCYCMRMLDQIHDLVVVADGGEGVGVWVRGAAEGSGLKR